MESCAARVQPCAVPAEPRAARAQPYAKARPRVSGALTALVAIAALTSAATPPAAAQLRVKAGAHALYQSQIFDGTFGYGGRAEIELGFIRSGLTVVGIYDHLLPDCDGCSYRGIGGQVLLASQGTLYVGAGASRQQFSRPAGAPASESGATEPLDDDWVFSLVAGVRLPVLPVIVPYVELRQEFGSELNKQVIAVGILLSPSRARAAPRGPGRG